MNLSLADLTWRVDTAPATGHPCCALGMTSGQKMSLLKREKYLKFSFCCVIIGYCYRIFASQEKNLYFRAFFLEVYCVIEKKNFLLKQKVGTV